MTTPDEEAAWRLIVDNYDETAVRETPPGAVRKEPTPEESPADEPAPEEPVAAPAEADWFSADQVEAAEEPTFTPPPPPAAPVVPLGRRAAWAVVGCVPLVFLLAALTGRTIPGTGAGLLALALVGAFVYLVLTMPDEPRDPWDDGSRV